MPAAPRPTFTRFTTAWVAASKMETSGPLNVETKTSLPSGVNFRRLAPVTFALNVCNTFLPARSRMEIVPSCAFAAQSSLPSGETSKPSAPRPTEITVSSQSPCGLPRPGTGARPAILFSMMVIVAELMFDVAMRFRSSETQIMCV